MKRVLHTFSAFVLSAGAAHAASPFDWNGIYGGLNVGGAFLDGSLVTQTSFPVTLSTTKLNDSSVTFGGQVGWNLQSGDFVLGVEGDFNYLDLKDNAAAVGAKDTTAVRADYDWFATIRGRAGVLFNSITLFYATGGLALLDSSLSYSRTAGAFGPVSLNKSDVLVGGTLGAGIEHAFTPNISAKIEYLFADFGGQRISDPLSAGAFGSAKPELHIIRAGVNWHF